MNKTAPQSAQAKVCTVMKQEGFCFKLLIGLYFILAGSYDGPWGNFHILPWHFKLGGPVQSGSDKARTGQLGLRGKLHCLKPIRKTVRYEQT